MADPSLIFPFNHTGIFTIGTGQPGAVTLKAILTVPHNSSIVSGHGTLSQATNPPLQGNTSFHGVVHALGLGPAKQIYALTGDPGASGDGDDVCHAAPYRARRHLGHQGHRHLQLPCGPPSTRTAAEP